MRIRCSTRSRIHKFWAREELNLRRSRTPETEESPLQLGANRPTPSPIDYPAGCRVRRLAAGFVLRVEASRSGVPLHVQALAFKSTSGDNSITDRARSKGSALVADALSMRAALFRAARSRLETVRSNTSGRPPWFADSRWCC